MAMVGAIIGEGLKIGGSLQAAYGAEEAGAASATAANTNAAIAQSNSQSAIAQAQQDVTVQERQNYIALGQIKSGYGASGVTGDSGSALDVLASSAGAAELTKQTIAYKGRMKALGYAEQSELDTRAGQTAMQQGEEKATSYLLQAGGDAASFASSYGASGSKPLSPSQAPISGEAPEDIV